MGVTFPTTSTSKSPTMSWEEDMATKVVGPTPGEALEVLVSQLTVLPILAAVPAVSAAVPTVAVAAAAVAPAPPTAAPTKCRTSAAAGIVEPVLLRCVAGGHQLCVEHQAGGAGCEERRVVGGQVG